MLSKKEEDAWIVSAAKNDTEEWMLNNPFIANENTALKHFERAVKKYAKLAGREAEGVVNAE